MVRKKPNMVVEISAATFDEISKTRTAIFPHKKLMTKLGMTVPEAGGTVMHDWVSLSTGSGVESDLIANGHVGQDRRINTIHHV